MARLTDRPAMTIAIDLGCKATKQTKQITVDEEIASLYIVREIKAISVS